MGRKRKILTLPPEGIEEVNRLILEEGWSYRDIAEYITLKYGLEIDHNAVWRYAKEVLGVDRDKLGNTLLLKVKTGVTPADIKRQMARNLRRQKLYKVNRELEAIAQTAKQTHRHAQPQATSTASTTSAKRTTDTTHTDDTGKHTDNQSTHTHPANKDIPSSKGYGGSGDEGSMSGGVAGGGAGGEAGGEAIDVDALFMESVESMRRVRRTYEELLEYVTASGDYSNVATLLRVLNAMRLLETDFASVVGTYAAVKLRGGGEEVDVEALFDEETLRRVVEAARELEGSAGKVPEHVSVSFDEVKRELTRGEDGGEE